MIPKTIHLMWLDKKDPYKNGYPQKYEENVKMWKKLNPDWDVLVWNYKSIESHFPEYMEILEKIPVWISKCDFARMLVLYKFGGVYVDLDFTPLRPFDDYVINRDIMVAEEPDQWVGEGEDGRLLVNIVASIPNHPFIKGWIDTIIQNTLTFNNKNKWDVFVMTGPRGFYLYYKTNPIITLNKHDSCSFMPTANERERKECANIEPFCYTYNNDSTWQVSKIKEYSHIIMFFIILIVILILIYNFILRKNRGFT